MPTPLRILLIADFNGPTQQISFHNPLAPSIQRGECHIEMLTEPELLTAAKSRPEHIEPDRAMLDMFETTFRRSIPDLVIFSRYGGPIATYMLKFARQAHVPIVAHFDDDLLGVPPDLGPDKYRRYNDPARLAAIHSVLQQSDLIYASTPALAQRLEDRGFDAPIVAGRIYCSGKSSGDVAPGQPLVLGYMGSGGHAHDLAIALPAIVRALKERPTMRFELFGTIPMPDVLRSFNSRIAHHSFNSDYNTFLQRLGELGWAVGLAPLADIPFNTVKANTKWVEYTCAGIAVIASDHAVYRESCAAGCGLLVNKDGWFDAISQLVDDAVARHMMVGKAREKVEYEFSSERLRSQLFSVFAQAGASRQPGHKP